MAFIAQFETEIYDVDGNGRKFTRGEVYARYLDYCEGKRIEKTVDVKRFHSVFRKALSDNNISYREKKTHEGTRLYVF